MSNPESDLPVGRHGRGANALGSTQGATAVDERKRRGGWLWLLLLLLAALIVLAILGAIFGWFSSGKSTHATAVTPTTILTPAAASTPTTVPNAGPASTPTTLEPAGNATDTTTPGAPGGGAGSLPPAGLVGGGGVKAVNAAGKVAAAGSIGDVLFNENSSNLDSNADTVVNEAVKEINAAHATSVNVVGYTDSIGDAAVNQKLSLQRARAVEAALKQQTGSNVTYTAKAEGQTKPVATNGTNGGRQLNRRVTIFDK